MKDSSIRVGSIVEAFVLDRRGENGKVRPSLVIQVDRDDVFVVCITSTFSPNALGADEIRLPYGELCNTGLSKPSVVVCSWFERIETSLCNKIGFVPSKLMVPIASRISAILAEKSQQRPST